MLLPDNINPELSIYYNGSIIISELKHKKIQRIMVLYENVKENNNMSFSTFVLSLDWLYLIDVIYINKIGEVELCS